MSIWLADAELVEATGGLVQPAAQVRFFRARGLNPIVGIDGRPRITRDAMTAYNLGQLPTKAAPQPNFAALKRAS